MQEEIVKMARMRVLLCLLAWLTHAHGYDDPRVGDNLQVFYNGEARQLPGWVYTKFSAKRRGSRRA